LINEAITELKEYLIGNALPTCPPREQDCEHCEYAKPDGGKWLCDYPYIGNEIVWWCK